MTFGEYMLGAFGATLLLSVAFPFMFDRERPVLSFLVAAVAVLLVAMPSLYLVVRPIVLYFLGY